MKLNATRKGLITGCLMIAVQLILFYGFKRTDDNSWQFIVYFVYAIGLAWSMMSFAPLITTSTKFSECFSNGFKTFVTVTLLMVLYTLIFYWLHPEIRDAQIEMNTQLILKQPNQTHTLPEIADNAKTMKAIFLPAKLAAATFFYLFLGAVMTTVYSLILLQKKKR
jgi:hypothetical protein